jgi:hypothetical protein
MTHEREEVRDMEGTRKLDPRILLVAAAVAAVAVTIWAAGAFAAGGSSSNGLGSSDPAAAYIQTQDDNAGPRGDCPHEDGGGGGGGSEGGSGSSGSGAGDL